MASLSKVKTKTTLTNSAKTTPPLSKLCLETFDNVYTTKIHMAYYHQISVLA